MQNYELILQSPVSKSFRSTKAANSLDIDQEKKSVHHFKVKADLESPYNIGLIVGASGSGKTTLARHIFGDKAFITLLDDTKPVIEQFDAKYSYDECASMLAGVGLTSVPCWIRPAYTLSNGQKARAECALQMAKHGDEVTIIDEWTSVVDRTIAKVMSHCISKHARKTNKRIILLACHYDIIEWLNPDWIIDCNEQSYTNRRLLWQDFKRTDRIQFDIRETTKSSWNFFSKYHYLSEKLAGGFNIFYGLYDGDKQIGFLSFANYVPWRHKHRPMILHFNRLVIHPDYCGFGLGIHFLNKCSQLVKNMPYQVMSKFSSMPVYHSLRNDPKWKLASIARDTNPKLGIRIKTKDASNTAFRLDVKTYSFLFKGE